MMEKIIVDVAHLLRNAEYLNELDPNQNWSRRFIHLIEHSINLRRENNITSRGKGTEDKDEESLG